MKKIGTLVVLLAIMASCKPELKDIGPRFVPGDGIFGQWEMNTLQVTDLNLPVPEKRDFSGFLTKTENRLIMTIKADGSYTIDQAGKVPQLLGTNGSWAFDAPDFPTMVHFVTAEGDSLSTDLLNMPRTIDNHFGFSFDRKKCDKEHINYEYKFIRK
jgi:hypothetical protein